MKKYNVYIDICEIMQVEANSKEEARDKALTELNEVTWNCDDAEVTVEEQ